MKLVMNESSHNNSNNNNNTVSSNNNSTNWLGFSLSSHHPTITCFDAGEHHAGFLSPPLPVMPLRSDDSLCIMAEDLSKSHQPSQEPKLENLLGGETMALSLDSLYYNQTAAQGAVSKHHHNQYDSFFSALACQGYYQATPDCHVTADNLVVVDNGNGNGNGDGGGFGEVQSLSLSMSPGSQSSCVTASQISISPLTATTAVESKKRGFAQMCQGNNNKQTVHRKSIDTFGHRTSQFRGVTKHRWTGRYEAHLWDNSCKKEGQTRKGRQVYLGGYDMEEKAGRAYDLAALKYWGLSTHTNFPVENYKEEIEEMKHMTRQEYVAHLRRKSSGFSRGASMYRGVTRHHQHGRWQARIGRVAGNKDLYLGTFSTQEEAAEAYDVAAIKFRGVNAVTNFDISRYDVEKIMASNTLLGGEQAKRNKVESTEVVEHSLSTPNAPEWKLVSRQPSSSCIESLDPKLAMVTVASSGNPLFSFELRDLVALEMTNPTQPPTREDSTKLDSAHFSNSSSLVTSLNSSREGSPDKSSPSLQLACDWIAPVPAAQLPLFAAWGDA